MVGRNAWRRHTVPVPFAPGIFVVTDKVIGNPSGDTPSSPSPIQAESQSRVAGISSAEQPIAPSTADQACSHQPPEQSSALLALGLKLAAARQVQGVSLEALANRLHLGVSQLQALECGDRNRLPEGVFVIAYARRIAETLGVSIDEELSALRGRPQDRAGRLSPPPVAGSERSAAPRSAASRPESGSKVPWRAALLTMAALGMAGLALSLRPWTRVQGLLVPPAPPAPTAAKPRLSPVALPQRRAAETPGSLVPIAPAPATAGTPALAPSGLLLSSDPSSWVSVRDPSGKVLFEGLLSGDRRFPLGSGLEVYAGRPDLVRASVEGGKARPLGTISDLRWHRFATTPRPKIDPAQEDQGPAVQTPGVVPQP